MKLCEQGFSLKQILLLVTFCCDIDNGNLFTETNMF